MTTLPVTVKILFRGGGLALFLLFSSRKQVTNRRQHLSTGSFNLQFGYWTPFSLPPSSFCNSLTFALISSAALQFFRHSCYFFLPSSFSGFSRLWLHAFSFPSLLFFTICSSSFFFFFHPFATSSFRIRVERSPSTAQSPSPL